MKRRLLPLSGAALVGVGLLVLRTTPLFAQPPTPDPATPTHEQMHQMMDAVHGPGTSERMHAAMAQAMGVGAEDVEQLMDRCVAMMSAGGQSSHAMSGMPRAMMGQ